MAGEPVVTIIGNITADPEIRYVGQQNQAVVNFTVASTPRIKKGDEWVDGDTLFVRASVWDDVAANVAESLVKGARVVIHGRLYLKSWQSQDGKEGQNIEMSVEEVAVSLRRATVKITKNQPKNQQGGFQQQQPPQQAQQSDPWAGTQQTSVPGDFQAPQGQAPPW